MRILPLLAIAISLTFAAPAINGLSITFAKIADTSTPIPGGSGTFPLFGVPVIEGGNVAFHDAFRRGIYTSSGGSLAMVADTNTPVPGAANTFVGGFSRIAIDDGNVAFIAVPDRGSIGIYTNAGGSLETVVDTSVAVPDGEGNFDAFFTVSLEGTDVVFTGRDGAILTNSGVYLHSGGSLTTVVDDNTPAPGGPGNLDLPGPAFLEDGNIALEAFDGDTRRGIYTNVSGSLALVAEVGMPVPGGNAPFRNVREPSFDGMNVSFLGQTDIILEDGVYSDIGGSVNVVADTTTLIPGRTDTFTRFHRTSMDSGNVAFLGGNDTMLGIYVSIGGILMKVVESGDELDGKIISELEMSAASLSGNEVAFLVRFADEGEGIYVATVPEPFTGLLLALGLLSIAVRQRRHTHTRGTYSRFRPISLGDSS